MSISNEETLHIAKLSKLEFLDKDLEKMSKDLSGIVDFANTLADVNVDNVKPTAHILDIKNVFREDISSDSYRREDILKNAPEAQGGCISVPKVVE